MTSLIHAVGHGLSASDPIRFGNIVPNDTGIDETQTYYVLAAGLTADDFAFSETDGGAAFTLTQDITDGIIRFGDEYAVVDDGIMSPPPVPATPTGLAWTSVAVLNSDGSSSVRIDIAIDVPSDPQTRQTVVTLVTGGTNPITVVIPPDQTTARVENVLGATSYVATAVAYDVYGTPSLDSATVTHTTVADASAPSTPTGFAVAGLIEGILTSWTAVSAADLAYYEVALSTDGGSSYPTTYRVYTTSFGIGNLAAATYFAKVRAVDRSGNASAYCTASSAAARAVAATDLADGSITLAKFASTIRPIPLVTALPTLPDATYPVGQFVYKTNDSPARLYKNVADAWVAGVGPNDIQADSITAGQIAAGAITSTELAVTLVLPGSLANESGGTPGVFIDSTGILIRSGKLTLQDEFGSSQLVASGFSGSWRAFIALGLYNADFDAGVVGTVGLGRTSALPYWTVSNKTGTPVLTYAAGKVTYDPAADNAEKKLVSDSVPVVIGQQYAYGIRKLINRGAGSVYTTVGVEFSNDPAFGSGVSGGIEETFVLSSGAGGTASNIETADTAVAQYARVYVILGQTTNHASNTIELQSAWLTRAPTMMLTPTVKDTLTIANDAVTGSEVLWIENNNRIIINGDLGDTVIGGDEAFLNIVDLEELTVGASVVLESPATLRIDSTGDVSLASTTHGFQIGLDSGVNFVMDNNEMQGRNNGAAATINLNLEGGNITLGPNAVITNSTGEFSTYSNNNWTSYTPVVAGLTGATHSTIVGYYQKIGKMVFVRIYLVSTANATGAGNVTITTPSNPDRTTRQVLVGNSEGHGIAGAIELVALTGGSGATWDRVRSSTGANMVGTDYDNGGIIIIQGVYAEA